MTRGSFSRIFRRPTSPPTPASAGTPRGRPFGVALLTNYDIGGGFNLGGRLEYIGSTGSTATAPNLLYSPGSGAFSLTLTSLRPISGIFLCPRRVFLGEDEQRRPRARPRPKPRRQFADPGDARNRHPVLVHSGNPIADAVGLVPVDPPGASTGPPQCPISRFRAYWNQRASQSGFPLRVDCRPSPIRWRTARSRRLRTFALRSGRPEQIYGQTAALSALDDRLCWGGDAGVWEEGG